MSCCVSGSWCIVVVSCCDDDVSCCDVVVSCCDVDVSCCGVVVSCYDVVVSCCDVVVTCSDVYLFWILFLLNKKMSTFNSTIVDIIFRPCQCSGSDESSVTTEIRPSVCKWRPSLQQACVTQRPSGHIKCPNPLPIQVFRNQNLFIFLWANWNE